MGDENDNNNNNKSFRANFTADGVTMLRDKVNDKLKEFMGDYTDETLVEYVIVLLKNGRSKAEAKNELNVFLGDDSDSFVSWLWDHLESSLHLYVQPHESTQIKPPSEDHVVTNDSDKAQSSKLHRSRHNREWRSIVRDEEAPPPFESTVAEKIHLDEKAHHKVRRSMRSTSPQKIVQKKRNSKPEEVPERKRNRPEEVPQPKRVIASQGTVGPARRLLQSAVREAVATSKPSNSTSEPALKRLRSIVSTSAADSSVENHPRRLRSLACVPNAMSTAMRAVEEAAKDVAKNNNSGNVFDRLGLSHASDQLTEFDESMVEDVNYGVVKEISAHTRPSHIQRRHYGGYHGDMTTLGSGDRLGSDSASDNEGYGQVNVIGRRGIGASRTSASGVYKDEDALMIEYSVDKTGNQYMPKPRKEQDQSAADVGTSNKVLNISVNVNTWKPSHYQEQGESQQVANRKTVLNIEPSLDRSGAWSTKERTNTAYVAKGNIKPGADISKESEKIPPANHGLYASGRPTVDVDSRTIFVSNVHFAATKDGLSRHFNKFGEVLKVIIVTDAATGQPKGSAYVEFMRKEAAENALSLDGTSFMSRILKVINKSSAHQDTAPIMSWPRAIRGSPFAPIARYGRGFFPRGNHNVGAYQARPPIKAGARSLQWKREETNTISSEEINNTMTTNNNGTNASLSSGNRSLTYVRADLNTNGHSATPS